MNRKTFLSTIAALISIPFLGKSKEKEPEIQPDTLRGFLHKAYEKDDGFITLYVDGKPVRCKTASFQEHYLEPPYEITYNPYRVTITSEEKEYITFKELEIPKKWK